MREMPCVHASVHFRAANCTTVLFCQMVIEPENGIVIWELHYHVTELGKCVNLRATVRSACFFHDNESDVG
jgi:hypothetical protein